MAIKAAVNIKTSLVEYHTAITIISGKKGFSEILSSNFKSVLS
jgi:hypothetical protein